MSVYDDKLILWNQGKLPEEITIEKLLQKHPSIPRNRLIADIFFKAGYIEAWGRGVEKISDGFQKAGKPEPLFEELGGGVMITLFKGSHEKVGEKVGEHLTKNQNLILNFIQLNQNISANELSMQVGISKRKIEENIHKLKDIGLLKRIGPAKGGHWQVVKSD